MKITPINITLACVLTWIISEWSNGQLNFSWWFVILFILLLIGVDIVFRLFVKENKKLWIGEVSFILVTSILLLIIKLTK